MRYSLLVIFTILKPPFFPFPSSLPSPVNLPISDDLRLSIVTGSGEEEEEEEEGNKVFTEDAQRNRDGEDGIIGEFLGVRVTARRSRSRRPCSRAGRVGISACWIKAHGTNLGRADTMGGGGGEGRCKGGKSVRATNRGEVLYGLGVLGEALGFGRGDGSDVGGGRFLREARHLKEMGWCIGTETPDERDRQTEACNAKLTGSWIRVVNNCSASCRSEGKGCLVGEGFQ